MSNLLIISVAVLFIGALFLISAYILMFLLNIVLEHYNIELLTYKVALALNGIIWFFTSVSNNINK